LAVVSDKTKTFSTAKGYLGFETPNSVKPTIRLMTLVSGLVGEMGSYVTAADFE
jgi:hypothetical protein